MSLITVPAWYYQQFDADLTLDVPAEGYGGWKKAEIEISTEHTALVVMHAWDSGTPEKYPGWYRSVEYLPRAAAIAARVFPELLSAVRASPFRLFHVVGGGDYYKDYPGYRIALDLAGPEPGPMEAVQPDRVLERLRCFRTEHVHVGLHNLEDVKQGFAGTDFIPEARPVGNEGIAANERQLFALCREHDINHLVYTGFALNWCLLLSPGGMADMSKRGIMCSTIRQAVTAVENKETARQELCKEIGLWRVALAFGFVFDIDDFTAAIRSQGRQSSSEK
ncbi:MAG: hypothetical protein PHT33_08655 [bacterium]|nr:hypothetical protein [bacterium]